MHKKVFMLKISVNIELSQSMKHTSYSYTVFSEKRYSLQLKIENQADLTPYSKSNFVQNHLTKYPIQQ